jgi:hypothetical protein
VSHPQPAPYQSYDQPPAHYPPAGPPPPPKQGSGLAVASMVLGIIALLLSWVPIINNVAAIVALVGLGLGIPALIWARRGTHGGTGLAITGLVTSVIALILVIVTQIFFVKVIDEVDRSTDASISGSEEAPVEADEEVASAVEETVPLGVSSQIGDYQVTVDAVELNANATVAGANQFNEPPAGQYVIAQLTVMM